jgi:hypothetical protein
LIVVRYVNVAKLRPSGLRRARKGLRRSGGFWGGVVVVGWVRFTSFPREKATIAVAI